MILKLYNLLGENAGADVTALSPVGGEPTSLQAPKTWSGVCEPATHFSNSNTSC